MASSTAGWIRVAAGARLVASAAAKHASVEAGSVLTRTAQHGVDMATTLQKTATVTGFDANFMQQPPPPPPHQHPKANPPINGVPSAAPTKMSPHSTSFVSSTASTYEENDAPKKGTTTPNDDFNGLLFHAARAEPSHAPPPETVDKEKKEEANDSEQTTSSVETDKKNQQISQFADDTSTISVPQLTSNDQHNHDSTSTATVTYKRLEEGKAVPSTRTGRAFGFASLGFGLAFGAMGEGLSRLLPSSSSSSSSILINDNNADRLAQSLCRMRGAALKMGQMLSIQDESLLPPELSRALKQVRQGADAMPEHQLQQQLVAQFGENWEDKFVSFDKLPFAAASVGQCHRAKLRVSLPEEDDDDSTNNTVVQDVVVKVQYPGVGSSIESDLQNLAMLVKWTGMAPKGLFLDNVIRVGKEELKVECDYNREIQQQQRMKELVESDPILRENNFVVPDVFPLVSTSEVITTAFAPGGTIDKVSHLDQEERNRIARTILYLTIQELFVWKFMQTDPNWGNFLYDVGTGTTSLIDFGATREYSKEFVDGYLRIVWASSNQDEERLMKQSYKMGFLTGEENDIMLHAHKHSGYTVGEPFRTNEPFDFRGSQLSTRMQQHSSAFLKHRLTPPPSEVYTLHRKLAGAFMLCIKLGAVIPCRDLLEDVIAKHVFEDGQDPPPL